MKKLRTPQKKYPRGKSKKSKGTPDLKTKHVVKAAIDSSLSGNQLTKHTDSLRSQRSRGDHAVKVPAGHTARKERSELNKVFVRCFKSITTSFSPDNGAVRMCTDVVDFLYQTIYARGRHPKEIAVLKFNLDGGRGSQKLMNHYLFDDDPILKHDSTEEGAKHTRKSTAGTKTPVLHTPSSSV